MVCFSILPQVGGTDSVTQRVASLLLARQVGDGFTDDHAPVGVQVRRVDGLFFALTFSPGNPEG